MVNRKLVAVLSVVAVFLLMSPIVSPAFAYTRIEKPIADSTVVKESPNSNYGKDRTLHARWDSTSEKWTYLKFDLSHVDCDEIDVVRLCLHVSAWTQVGMVVNLHRCLDDTWTEMGITWNNKPGKGLLIEQQTSLIDCHYMIFSSVALTTYVKTQCLGDGIVSFVLQQHVYREDPTWHTDWSSKEAAKKPSLAINCCCAVVGGFSLPVDKLALLAPYIALAIAVVAVTLGAVSGRRWLGKAVVPRL